MHELTAIEAAELEIWWDIAGGERKYEQTIEEARTELNRAIAAWHGN